MGFRTKSCPPSLISGLKRLDLFPKPRYLWYPSAKGSCAVRYLHRCAAFDDHHQKIVNTYHSTKTILCITYGILSYLMLDHFLMVTIKYCTVFCSANSTRGSWLITQRSDICGVALSLSLSLRGRGFGGDDEVTRLRHVGLRGGDEVTRLRHVGIFQGLICHASWRTCRVLSHAHALWERALPPS